MMSSTGIRVPFKTGRPLTRKGSISTSGHLDQSTDSIPDLLISILADFIWVKRPKSSQQRAIASSLHINLSKTQFPRRLGGSSSDLCLLICVHPRESAVRFWFSNSGDFGNLSDQCHQCKSV